MSEDEEVPQQLMDIWVKQCNCCHVCNQMKPCGGIMAGGLCDDLCECNDDYDESDGCCLHGIGFDEYCDECGI
jgi:hypothetical protein